MPQVRPIFDKVLVSRIELPEPGVEQSVLVIPDTVKEKPQFGVVVSAGDTKYVKPDMLVLFGKYSGIDFTIGKQEFLILREEEVIGIVEGVEITKEVHNG